jgi:carboxyl-terminal processing protease
MGVRHQRPLSDQLPVGHRPRGPQYSESVPQGQLDWQSSPVQVLISAIGFLRPGGVNVVKSQYGKISLGLASLLMVAASAPVIAAGEPSGPSRVPQGLVAVVQDITDKVLGHHIDPPARQQMILTGIKALYKAAGAAVPGGLSGRVSRVTTSEELAPLLEDVWPAATSKLVTISELQEALLNGLLTSVSGEPQLVPEKERKVHEQTEGNRYVGIHVALGMDEQEKRPKMNEVMEGGPADRAGIKRDDLIEQIEGFDTKGISLRDAVDRLRGDEGTKVTIKVRQAGAGAARTYTIVRGQHPRQSIRGWRKKANGEWDYRMPGSAAIAYVQLSEFVGSTPHELRKLAAQLERDRTRAIVVDLRGVWSTSVHTALLIADSLLEHGSIGRVRTSHGETTYHADADALFREWPMAVLVDRNTSGASEWLAAALQDNNRAAVIGAPTLSASINPGNAVVKTSLPLTGGEWSLSLATGVLERANGTPLSLFDRSMPTMIRGAQAKAAGVHPDHLVNENSAGRAPRVPTSPDRVEKKAVELLEQSLKKTRTEV